LDIKAQKDWFGEVAVFGDKGGRIKVGGVYVDVIVRAGPSCLVLGEGIGT